MNPEGAPSQSRGGDVTNFERAPQQDQQDIRIHDIAGIQVWARIIRQWMTSICLWMAEYHNILYVPRGYPFVATPPPNGEGVLVRFADC